MKKLFCMLLAVIMLVTVTGTVQLTALAEDSVYSGDVNETVSYTYNSKTGKLTFIGSGKAELKERPWNATSYADGVCTYYKNGQVVSNEAVEEYKAYLDGLKWLDGEVKSIVFSDGITGGGMFSSVGDSVESIYLGADFEGEVFYSLNCLTEIEVSEENEKYVAEDGILYSKDMSVLYLVPYGLKLDTFYVPSGVKVIEREAFGYYETDEGYNESVEIKNIIFPKSVKHIKENYIKNAEKIFIFNKKCKLDNYYGDDNNFCLSWFATTYMVGAKYYNPEDHIDETVNKFAPLIYKDSRYYAIGNSEYEYTGKIINPDYTVFNKKCKMLKAKKDYKIKYSKGRKKVGKYSYTVNFKKGKNKKKKYYFTIVPASVEVTGASVKGRKLKIKWRKHAKETTGFEIKYTPDGKKWKTIRIKNKKATAKTVRFNKKPKNWSFYIRAYKIVKGKKYYSNMNF